MRDPISPSTQGSQGTILFQEKDRAIQHVLESILGMSPNIIEQVKAWMDYQEASCMAHLMDIYTDSPKSIQQPEYKVGQTKHYLSKWVITGLYFACKFGAYKTKQLNRLLSDQG